MDRTSPASWLAVLACHGSDPLAVRTAWAAPLTLVFVCILGACKYDSDEPCGPGQVVKNGLCACAEGRMLIGRTCVESVTVVGGSSGDASDGGASGAGGPCSTNADCTQPMYPACVTRNASSGYCSRTGCAADCPQGFFCATDAAPSYCKRTPTGQNVACQTQADCAGNDATYCALNPATNKSSCVVRDCMAGGCSPSNATCLDLSIYMPDGPKICVPAS